MFLADSSGAKQGRDGVARAGFPQESLQPDDVEAKKA